MILSCNQQARVYAYTVSKYGSFYIFSYLSRPILRQKLLVLQQFQSSICLLTHNMWKAFTVQCHHQGLSVCDGGFLCFVVLGFFNSLSTFSARNDYFSYKNEYRPSNDEFLNPQRIHSLLTSSPPLKDYLESSNPRLDYHKIVKSVIGHK